jgi:hypothetical protein
MLAETPLSGARSSQNITTHEKDTGKRAAHKVPAAQSVAVPVALDSP